MFVRMCPKLPVIANQSADWCGNPPVRGEMYRQASEKTGIVTIFGGNRYPVPFNRGIATPVCALARNDSIIFQTPIYFPDAMSSKQHPRRRASGDVGDSVRQSGGRRRRCRRYTLWPPAGRCSHGTHGPPLAAPVCHSISTGKGYPWQ